MTHHCCGLQLEDLLAGSPQVSPLAWWLSYEYPVHRIGPDYQPAAPPSEPTFLIVYRNRQDQVQFMVTNAMTQYLLQLLQQSPAPTGEAALRQLAIDSGHPDPATLQAMGHDLLRKLQELDIIL